MLKRAQNTLKLVLDEIDQPGLETIRDQALNERDYGDLSGLNKDDARAKWGEEEKASITTTVHRDAAPLTKTGKIFITNTVYPGYELPSTGGRGTAPFVLAGGIMVLGAALLLACGRVRRRKEETK